MKVSPMNEDIKAALDWYMSARPHINIKDQRPDVAAILAGGERLLVLMAEELLRLLRRPSC